MSNSYSGTKPQRDAMLLDASISHWERLYNTLDGAEDCGASDCPLCGEYSGCMCEGCPIFEFTNASLCGGTPYAGARIARKMAKIDRSPENVDSWKKTATDMIYFLEAIKEAINDKAE